MMARPSPASQDPAQRHACSYAEFRHSQYRLVTLLWSILMGAMYLCSQNRTPHVGPIHSVLFVLVELLCISVGVSSQKGRPSHLRLAMTLLYIVRNVFYSLVAFGTQGPRNEEFFPSFAAISSVASLLWSAGSLIHLPKPRLLVCIQACILMCAYTSSGLPLLVAAAQSGAVHALCILMYTVLDKVDRVNYRKYLQGLQAAQREAAASASMQKASAKTGVGAEEASCGQTKDACPDQGTGSAAAAAADHTSSLHSAPTKDAPPDQGTSSSAADPAHAASLDAAHPARGSISSAAASRSEKLRSSSLGAAPPTDTASAQARLHAAPAAFAEPAYRQRIQKYQVVVKLHSSLHPRDLPSSALPDFVSCMQQRMPQCTFGNASIRAGCVLMSLDVYSSEDANKTHDCAGTAIQDWLHCYPAVLEQMPAAMPVVLQVDGNATCMERDPTSKTWRSLSLSGSPLQTHSHGLSSSTGAVSQLTGAHPSQRQEEEKQSAPPFPFAQLSHRQEEDKQSAPPFPLAHPSCEQEETQHSTPSFTLTHPSRKQEAHPDASAVCASKHWEGLAHVACRLEGSVHAEMRAECSQHRAWSSRSVSESSCSSSYEQLVQQLAEVEAAAMHGSPSAESSTHRVCVSRRVTDSGCCSSYEQLVQQLAEAEAAVAESGCSDVTASSVTASSCATPHVGSNSPALMDIGRLGSHKCGGLMVHAEPEPL